MKKFIAPLVQRLVISVILTYDLASYKQMADVLLVEQQVCQFHLRRWVGRTLRELKQALPPEWLGVIEETQTLIQELPIEGVRRLLQLWRQIPETRQGRFGTELSPPGPIALHAGPFGAKLGPLPSIRLATGCALDEKPDRTGHKAHENESSNRARL